MQEKRHETEEKEHKFEVYFSSLVEKFIASLHIYLASILGRYRIFQRLEIAYNL